MTDDLRARCARAVHVLKTDGTLLRAGRASLFVLRVDGYRRTATVLAVPPLVWFVELGYWIVARNRSFFGRFLFRKEDPMPGSQT